jgi:hypothetical protein
MASIPVTWRPLGQVPAAELIEARLQLHWAIQAPAAAAATLVTAAADDSHLALAWDEGHGALLTMPLPDGRRAGLILATAELVLLQASGQVDQRLSLHGQTLDQALAWLAAEVGDGRRLERPAHEMPEHPVGAGEPFSLGDLEKATVEMAGWYADAAQALEHLVAGRDQASAVRCWPHHFDIATLEVLDAGAGPEEARSVGLGMTPGDGGFPEPYFYVLPWPRPEQDGLPALAGGGEWHTGDWLGAVLHAAAIRRDTDPGEQARRVGDFLSSAHAAAQKLLAG